MTRLHVLVTALLAASCAAGPRAQGSSSPQIERSDVLQLGEAFDSSIGGLRVIGVQDEFHVVRCTEGPGAIGGCYDTIFAIPLDQVRFNRWIPVPGTPGLDVALVTPTRVAFQIRPESGTSR